MHCSSYLAFASLSTVGVWAQTAATTLDGALLSSQAEALKSMFPSATPYTVPFEIPGGNLVKPPPSVVAALITGVPPTVLAQLAFPSGRSSLQSEFKAGNTPAWYEDLPEGVKDYVNSMRSQVAAGAVNLSATPVEAVATKATGETGETGGDEGEGSTDGEGNGDIAEASSSTSSGLAPRITGEVSASVVGALGILGLAIIL